MTDDAVTNKFLIPAGTRISARSFVSFEAESNSGFLEAGGEPSFDQCGQYPGLGRRAV